MKTEYNGKNDKKTEVKEQSGFDIVSRENMGFLKK